VFGIPHFQNLASVVPFNFRTARMSYRAALPCPWTLFLRTRVKATIAAHMKGIRRARTRDGHVWSNFDGRGCSLPVRASHAIRRRVMQSARNSHGDQENSLPYANQLVHSIMCVRMPRTKQDDSSQGDKGDGGSELLQARTVQLSSYPHPFNPRATQVCYMKQLPPTKSSGLHRPVSRPWQPGG
jgi:hypothetical protein